MDKMTATELVHAAVIAINKSKITKPEILSCIRNNYHTLLEDSTINQHIYSLCVNRPRRAENHSHKDKNERYHLLFSEGRGLVSLYSPDKHGYWINGKRCDDKLPIYPDDLPDNSSEYREGKKKVVAINIHERNFAARQACVSHYGNYCFICKVDFGKTYGEECEGLINVHHLKMISETDGEYKIDPIAGLRPVCPNCHMVLHSKSKNECYTIEEVKAMLKRQRTAKCIQAARDI